MVTSLIQSEVVFDELERLNEQYQQLNSAFEAQAKELSESQVCTWAPSSAHQVPTVQCWWYMGTFISTPGAYCTVLVV